MSSGTGRVQVRMWDCGVVMLPTSATVSITWCGDPGLISYLLYVRFVNSPPAGSALPSVRMRTRLMLSYNTFQFKLSSLIVSSLQQPWPEFLHVPLTSRSSAPVLSLGFP